MNEVEQRLWNQASIAAKQYVNSLGGGVVANLVDPAVKAQAIYDQTVYNYNRMIEEYNRNQAY